MIRTPAVAGRFYPAGRNALAQEVNRLMPTRASSDQQNCLAVISPHAGYIYSGAVAGQTFSRIVVPENVIVLGPNHHGGGSRISLMNEGSWEMVLGPVPMNPPLAKLILAHAPDIKVDDEAHLAEHSIEVQVPFLQFKQPDLKLVPIVISMISFATCYEIGLAIAGAVKQFNREVLIVASTDMSHYESRDSASRKDRLALERILALDPQGLYETVFTEGITMCGVIPTTIALVASLALGAASADLIAYSDSGETSGDTSQVVGYAGLVIS